MKIYFLTAAMVLLGACQESGTGAKHEGPVHNFLDVPVEQLHEQTEKYLGAVFEDRFQLAGAESPAPGQKAEPGLRVQARPVAQSARVIRLRVPSPLEKRVGEAIAAKIPVKARLRFSGIGPGGRPDFELMAVLE